MSPKFKTFLPRPIALLRRVVEQDLEAWHEFVETYVGFLNSVVWRYAKGDFDLASELVLVILEGLRLPDAQGRPFHRLRCYLDSLDHYGNRSKFTTWLSLVAKNLLRDWFRQREGRRLLPKDIEELDATSQAIFRSIFWEGLSENDAFFQLRTQHPQLDFEEFANGLDRVYRCLSDRKLYRLYQDLLRRIPTISINSKPLQLWEQLLEDTRQESRPDLALENKNRRSDAQKIKQILQSAIAQLPTTTRQVLKSIVLRGLNGQQVKRLMGFRKRQQVYDEMARARRILGKSLTKKGITQEQVKQLTDWMDQEEQKT